jgi:hypothetical protein
MYLRGSMSSCTLVTLDSRTVAWRHLRGRGFRALRVPNEDVHSALGAVLEAIAAAQLLANPAPPPDAGKRP